MKKKQAAMNVARPMRARLWERERKREKAHCLILLALLVVSLISKLIKLKIIGALGWCGGHWQSGVKSNDFHNQQQYQHKKKTPSAAVT